MTNKEPNERDSTLTEERTSEETDYLLGIPGMRESILEGMAIPLDKTSDEPGW